jgi:hypothetical protein
LKEIIKTFAPDSVVVSTVRGVEGVVAGCFKIKIILRN